MNTFKALITVAFKLKIPNNGVMLTAALADVMRGDTTYELSLDTKTGQTILGGQDELQLEVIISKIIHELNIALDVGAPQVACRETIARATTINYTHKKQSGGSGQFAKISLDFEPLPPGTGYQFESKVVGGAVPKEFIPGVEKGLASAKETGVYAGFPCIDFKATLTDGAYHDVDSSVLAFEIAARAAFREGMLKASPTLLEPMMKVEVVTPENFMGDVIGDLNSRRGQISGMDQRGNAHVVNATVPLAEMFGYVNNLRSMTQGRASYSMQFDHYAPMPNELPPNDDLFPPAAARRA